MRDRSTFHVLLIFGRTLDPIFSVGNPEYLPRDSKQVPESSG